MPRVLFIAVVLLASTALVPAGHAATINVLDPGFETRDIDDGTFKNFISSDAWTIFPSGNAGSGPLDPENSLFPGLTEAGSGAQFGASINAGFGQTLSAAFDPESRYRIDFQVVPSASGTSIGNGYGKGSCALRWDPPQPGSAPTRFAAG